MVDKRDTVFVKDGNTYVVTGKNAFYIWGRRNVVVRGETREVCDQIPRNVAGRLIECIDWAELSYPGLFWGVLALVCIAIGAFCAIATYELDPMTYGVDVCSAIVITVTIAYAACAVICTGFWATEAFIPWIKYRA